MPKSTVLTAEQMAQIDVLHRPKHSTRAIAKALGISQWVIAKYVRDPQSYKTENVALRRPSCIMETKTTLNLAFQSAFEAKPYRLFRELRCLLWPKRLNSRSNLQILSLGGKGDSGAYHNTVHQPEECVLNYLNHS